MTVSSSQPPMPAYGEPAPDRGDHLPWPRMIARMILVILPGLLVGSFVGGIVVTVLGVQVLRSAPGLTLIIPLVAGLVTGVGLGVVIKPGRDRLLAVAGVAAAVAAVGDLLLLLLARLRVPGAASGSTVIGLLTGVLIVVVVQTAISVLIWSRRRA